MAKKLTLLELIKEIELFNEDLNLCLLKNFLNFDINTQCILLDDEEIDQKEKTKDFQYIFGLYTLKDILENLRAQKIKFSPHEAVEAIEFYLRNDSFIDINKK